MHYTCKLVSNMVMVIFLALCKLDPVSLHNTAAMNKLFFFIIKNWCSSLLPFLVAPFLCSVQLKHCFFIYYRTYPLPRYLTPNRAWVLFRFLSTCTLNLPAQLSWYCEILVAIMFSALNFWKILIISNFGSWVELCDMFICRKKQQIIIQIRTFVFL